MFDVSHYRLGLGLGLDTSDNITFDRRQVASDTSYCWLLLYDDWLFVEQIAAGGWCGEDHGL